MNCFTYFCSFRARVRAGVGVAKRGHYFGTSVFFLFVLHLAVKKVGVNWIQKLRYVEGGIPWRECNILWTTCPESICCVHSVRPEMKE